MIPVVIQGGDISFDDHVLLNMVRQIVSCLPNGLDCHDVCAEVSSRIPKLVVDCGWFHRKGWDHSWLVLPGRDIIIDAYPWCCVSGPIMIYTGGTLNPWRDLYIKKS